MKKVVIAIDSFKGCLTSVEAGQAAAEGVHSVFPECEVICLPVADGGEGMLEVLTAATSGKHIATRAHNALMEWQDTRYAISGDGETAFIEMASISGLPLIPADRRNPMKTTSFGTGELIRDALDRGCRNFIIGLGGSATNEAGLGMLQALGVRFFNKEGKEVGIADSGEMLGIDGEMMAEVSSIDLSSMHPALKDTHFMAACDVCNPFVGEDGASFVFAPQKGADAGMVVELDNGMRHVAEIIRQTVGKDISRHPGAGAAGGMGGGLLAFLNAELKPGIRLVLDVLRFSERIKDADLIITGEGKADRQTVMGKVPYGILEEAKKQRIPVILLAGAVEDTEVLNAAGFQGVFSITPYPVSLKEAMNQSFARYHIQRTTAQVCRLCSELSAF